MKKRLLALGLILTMAVSMVACGSGEAVSREEDVYKRQTTA